MRHDNVLNICRIHLACGYSGDRQRARIVLLAAEGRTQEAIGEAVGVTRVTVNHWRRRFAKERLAGLAVAPERGRKPSLPLSSVKKTLETVTRSPATLGRWRCRTTAQAAGISTASVQRLWVANDIKPHLTRTFKLFNGAHFDEKFWYISGLYLNPPEKALVLCCDEKSQCQALEGTQPGPPLGIGHIYTATHDYICHGTLTLFASLKESADTVIAFPPSVIRIRSAPSGRPRARILCARFRRPARPCFSRRLDCIVTYETLH